MSSIPLLYRPFSLCKNPFRSERSHLTLRNELKMMRRPEVNQNNPRLSMISEICYPGACFSYLIHHKILSSSILPCGLPRRRFDLVSACSSSKKYSRFSWAFSFRRLRPPLLLQLFAPGSFFFGSLRNILLAALPSVFWSSILFFRLNLGGTCTQCLSLVAQSDPRFSLPLRPGHIFLVCRFL